MAEKMIKEYHFEKCILGTAGFYKMTGFTITDSNSARIYDNEIEHSDNTIILMDSHKFNKASSICYSKGENISMVITDNNITLEVRKTFFGFGINLRIAKND